MKYGSWDGSGWVPGIALPTPTQPYPTPGTPPPTHRMVTGLLGLAVPTKGVVGLKSVAQLTLRAHFSGFQGITEGYNLLVAGNPNDHNSIPRTK